MFCQRWEALPRSIPLTKIDEIPPTHPVGLTNPIESSASKQLGFLSLLLNLPFTGEGKEGSRSLVVALYLYVLKK